MTAGVLVARLRVTPLLMVTSGAARDTAAPISLLQMGVKCLRALASGTLWLSSRPSFGTSAPLPPRVLVRIIGVASLALMMSCFTRAATGASHVW